MKRSRFKEQGNTILREYEAGHKTEDFDPKRGIRSASFPSPSYSRRRQKWTDYAVLTMVYVPFRCGKKRHGSVCQNPCRRWELF